MMADRARRYERRFRQRQGVTEDAMRLIAERGAVVQGGPFAGMRYPADLIADVDTPRGKLLGSYEHEIQQPFMAALRRGVRTFIDVGCADGYYAVGMPVADHQITSYAFDLASSARRLCFEVALINAVESRVRIGRRFSTPALESIDPRDGIMLCDIEGAEADLFDPQLVARLDATTVLIEVHETGRPGLSDYLRRTFDKTHVISRVEQASRESGLQEFRPPELHWLVCDPI
jgi:hypothetical protein